MKTLMIVEMPDGSKWSVPVEMIAKSRAAHYAYEFNGDVDKSLKEDTIPLFEADEYEIQDWAQNNMYWKDISDYAKQVCIADTNFEEGWMNGAKTFE